MSDKEPSFMRLVAISTLHLLCPEAKVASEAREVEEARRIERFRQALKKIAGYNVDFNITVNGGCLEVMVDDLRFVAYEMTSPQTKEQWTMVTLLGRCSACGVETMSEPFCDLVGLGKMLEEFVPIFHHCCHARSK
jgi:hypothetical protein